VLGIVLVEVEFYACPGQEEPLGSLAVGETFAVLGWDEFETEGGLVDWILIEDEIERPQKWVIADESIMVSPPNYKEFMPQVACRSSS
jgi:hypothetical protein